MIPVNTARILLGFVRWVPRTPTDDGNEEHYSVFKRLMIGFEPARFTALKSG